MTRVAIVADSPLLRAGLEALLAVEPRLALVGAVGGGEGADAAAVAALVAPLAPDVVLWAAPPDAASDGEEGTDASGDPAPAALVVLLDHPDAGRVRRALDAGARGVLPLDASPDELVAAVHAAAAGLLVLPPSLATELLVPAARPVAMADGGTALTPREREVLALLAQGLANKAIAPRLGITEHTVKAHVAAIYDKLGAGNRAEAVMAAARRGLVMV